MKKVITMLLIVSLIFCMFSVSTLARTIISPEQGTITVVPEEPTTPENPTTPDQPATPAQPTSPQTGGVPVLFVMLFALLLCGTAVVTARKAMHA